METLNFRQNFFCQALQQPTPAMKDLYYQAETLLEHVNEMAHTQAMLLVVLVSYLYQVKSLLINFCV